MTEFAVIGAGVVGGLIARELSFRKDAHVTVYEKENDVSMGASRANSAIVHAGFDAKTGTLKARLNVEGSEMMEETARELGVRYRRNGSLVVAFSEEETKTLYELLERGRANGVRDLLVITDRAELLRIEPMLGDEVVAALSAPTGAIICPYTLAIAAVGNAMDNGASLYTNAEVKAIRASGDRYELETARGIFHADCVINCAGVYADRVAKSAGNDGYEVHPRRGEYLLLDKASGKTVNHTVFQVPTKLGKGILVSPTVDGNLILGPTAEDIADKDDRSTTADGLTKVQIGASRSIKNLNFRDVITSFCGLRAVGATGDFSIDRAAQGLIHCVGIESPGLTASPAIARYVAAMLTEDGLLSPEIREDAVRTRAPSDAFREMSEDEKNEIIRKDPAYGRIVCRCEGVSEGEIRDAIRRNPRPTDTDGVKRRTRSGMGRCQGGFCSPTVVQILAEETGIPYAEVTKFGGASYYNLARTKGESDK